MSLRLNFFGFSLSGISHLQLLGSVGLCLSTNLRGFRPLFLWILFQCQSFFSFSVSADMNVIIHAVLYYVLLFLSHRYSPPPGSSLPLFPSLFLLFRLCKFLDEFYWFVLKFTHSILCHFHWTTVSIQQVCVCVRETEKDTVFFCSTIFI